MANSGRGSGGAGRRPTKAERRDEARRQREEIQRQIAHRRRNRSIGLALVAVAAAIVIVAAFLTAGGGSGVASAAALLKKAPSEEKTAACTPVQTVSFYGGVSDTNSPNYADQSHIGVSPNFRHPPALSTYPSVPPTSGPHDQVPLQAGLYSSPPPIYRAIHSLEHGGVIIWYSPDATGAALSDLKAFYGQRASSTYVGQDRVIIAPYDYPNQGAAGQLPSGVQMALVVWHHLQTCGQVNLSAAFDFSSQYGYYKPPLLGRAWKGEAPEAGGVM